MNRKNQKLYTSTFFNEFETIFEEEIEFHSKSPRPNSLNNKKDMNMGAKAAKAQLKGPTTAR